MATATVKWLNDAKGYRFVAPSAGSEYVFVQFSAPARGGVRHR